MNFVSVIGLLMLLVAATHGKPAHHKKHHRTLAGGIETRGPGCGGKPADVFFLLDTSSSIWREDFKKQLAFVNDVVDLFEIGPDDTRVGVATFSTTYHRQFGLTQYQDKDQVKKAISQIPYRGGDTYTGTALYYMRNKEFAPEIVRDGVAKIAIVMTDGKSRFPAKTLMEAKLAKMDDIHIFAIGIGDRSKYNYTELVKMGSEPTENFVFEVASFDALESLKGQLSLNECEEEPIPIQDQPACAADLMADVMFVFDSNAVGARKTNIIQEYIGGVVDQFNFAKDGMRAGVVSRNCHDGDIQLGEHSDKDEFIKDLRNRDYPELSHVIRRMWTHSFSVEQGAREMARRVAVIFVDDKLEVPKRVFHEINKAKGDDIEIFVVAVGDDVDMAEVDSMATGIDHVIEIPNYDVMTDSCETLVDMICSGN